MRGDDVAGVGDVVDVELHAPRALAPPGGGVGRHVAGQAHGVAGVGVAAGHQVGAGAHAEAAVQILGDPEVGSVARGEGAALALHGLAVIARGRAGDLGVEEGVAHDGAPAGGQFAAQAPLEAVGATGADGGQLVGGGVGVADVGAVQAEQREGGAEAAVEQVVLGTDLGVGGLFGVQVGVAVAQGEGFAGGLEGTAPRQVVRLGCVRLVDGAQAGADVVVGALQLAAGVALAGFLLEVVIAQTGQHFPLLVDGDHVLHVQAHGLEAAEVVVGGVAAGQARQGGQHGVEDVHGANVALGVRDQILVLLAQFQTIEQLVLQAAQVSPLGEFGLVAPAVFTPEDVAVREAGGAGSCIDRGGGGVVAVQFVVVVAGGVAQRQGVVDAMGDDAGVGLDLGVGVVSIAGVGGAVVGARVHVHGTALVGGDAEVGHAAVIQVFGLQEHLGVGRELDLGGRRDGLAVEELLVAVAVGLLNGAGEAPGQALVAIGAAQISFQPAVLPGAQAEVGGGNVLAGFLADAVDEAAGGATAVQDGGRALDDIDAFDVGEVAEVQGVVAEAVDVLVGNGREAADGDLVTLAVTVGEGHAGHVLQGVLHGVDVLVFQDTGRNDVDGLRHVAQRGVGLGAAGGVGRGVAVILGTDDVHGGQGGAVGFLGVGRGDQRGRQKKREGKCLGVVHDGGR